MIDPNDDNQDSYDDDIPEDSPLNQIVKMELDRIIDCSRYDSDDVAEFGEDSHE